jgi:hypothetical protein
MPRPVLLLLALLSATPALPAADPGPPEIPLPPLSTAFPSQPGPDELPVREEMPAALVRDDGTKVTSASDWPLRRAEMRRILEHYATGHAPPPPGNVKGRVLTTLTVLEGKAKYRLLRLTFGPGEKLQLDLGIFTPLTGEPFPAIIAPAGTPPGATPLPRLPPGPGQGKGGNPLQFTGPKAAEGESPDAALARAGGNPTETTRSPGPDEADVVAARVRHVLDRGYAYVMFNHNDCGEDTTLRNADGGWAFRTTRFFPTYPGYDWGLLRNWAWGVSRIVDFLVTDPAIDGAKLVVTGVSRTGKSALVAGAFDERIALTAPVVTGGGGVGAYRFSGAGRGGKEGLGEMMWKYPNWFSPHLRAFRGRTERLPFDQHWFLALIAPRAFLALEGTTDAVSLQNAVQQSWLGARPVYELLGVPERLGVNYAEHGHAFTADDWTALLDFADQHLRGIPGERRFDRFPPERLALWNGRDLAGWQVFLNDPAVIPTNTWSATDGVLRLDTKASGYLKTERSFSNYRLHVEWRWPGPDTSANANSGVLLHVHGPDAVWPLCFEAQLKNGNAGQVVGMGLDIPDAPLQNNRKRAPRLADSSEKPPGEWNTYEIYARGDAIEVFVNGVRQNQVGKLPVSAGRIALQMEGFPIEFRNVWLEQL